MSRPSVYSAAVFAEICERLSRGEPMAAICRDEGMPHPSTVWRWAEADAFVSQSIARAREDGFDAIALQALEIADDSRNDFIDKLADEGDAKAEEVRANGEVIQRSRLRVETRLKLLAKWDPKRYGDKVQQVLSGPNDGPIALATNALSDDDLAAIAAGRR